jgi:broad-specificity NMP kinase
MNDFVFVKDLAKDIGLDRSSVLKALKKSGYKIEKARCNIAAQMVACVSKDDAERFKAHRESLGFIQKDTPENLIYVVHPDFEKRPNRIKVGITTDMQNRMQHSKNLGSSSAM